MPTIPREDDEATSSTSQSTRVPQNSDRAVAASVGSREPSVPQKANAAANERVASSNQPPKAGTARTVTKSRRPAVADADVSRWLGAADFSDSSSSEPKTTSGATAGRRSETGHGTSDDALLSRIADRLAERNIASFQRIGLDIKSGIITVRGTVNSKGERLLLMHILRTTPGVRMVQDGLVLNSARSAGWKPSDLLNSISIESLPSVPSVASIQDAVSNVNPVHATVVAALLALGAIFFWPRGVSRPVAVYPLKGSVVLDGTPLAQATVVLHPTGDSKLPSGILPRGTADADGSLVFQTFDSADGSPEGSFVATVHLMKPVLAEGELVPGPDLSPAVYRTPETSPLKVTITRETKEISALVLHKHKRDDASNN